MNINEHQWKITAARPQWGVWGAEPPQWDQGVWGAEPPQWDQGGLGGRAPRVNPQPPLTKPIARPQRGPRLRPPQINENQWTSIQNQWISMESNEHPFRNNGKQWKVNDKHWASMRNQWTAMNTQWRKRIITVLRKFSFLGYQAFSWAYFRYSMINL